MPIGPGLSGSVAGVMLCGVSTSVPEPVTTLAAVRRGAPETFPTALIILLNAILLLGMLYRQTRGPGNIGLESVLILLVYAGGFIVLAGIN